MRIINNHNIHINLCVLTHTHNQLHDITDRGRDKFAEEKKILSLIWLLDYNNYLND
jgi:hypothetical protein